jgi:hypothetical protein
MTSAGIGFTSVVFMVFIVAYALHTVKGLLTPARGRHRSGQCGLLGEVVAG